jgi:peptide-methionine (S)-S-oxide reductase
MHIHDPTTLNRQGYDTGSQYRSIIFYEKGNSKEQEAIRAVLEEVRKDGQYPGYPAEIVTEVKELEEFYPAEDFHQNYYNDNTNQGYCKVIIKPKIGKLK